MPNGKRGPMRLGARSVRVMLRHPIRYIKKRAAVLGGPKLSNFGLLPKGGPVGLIRGAARRAGGARRARRAR